MNDHPSDQTTQRVDGEESPVDALRSAARHFGEAKEYASNFVAAKLDATKVSIRRLVLMIGFLVVAGLCGAAVLITAAVLLTNGMATGLGTAFDPDKIWLGQIIVGGVIVIGVNVAVLLVIRKLTGASREKTVQKYEARHRQQRSEFGRDVTTAN